MFDDFRVRQLRDYFMICGIIRSLANLGTSPNMPAQAHEVPGKFWLRVHIPSSRESPGYPGLVRKPGHLASQENPGPEHRGSVHHLKAIGQRHRHGHTRAPGIAGVPCAR